MARLKREVMLLTLDTETIGLGGALKRIAIYDGMDVHYGYDFDDVEWVLLKYYQLGYSVHCYIHNLEFDARKIPKILCKENTNWNRTVQIDGRFAKIACKYYTFHDSWRLLPSSLDKLSKDFDVTHAKMDLWKAVQEAYPGQYTDKVDFFNRCDKDDPIYVKYLGYDVISLYEVIMKLLKVSGLELDELVGRLSTASLSKYIFRKGYKGKPFITPGQSQTDYEILTSMKGWSSKKKLKQQYGGDPVSYLEIENKIRDGYFGGRTEVFTPWAQPLQENGVRKIVARHYDVNSLYPSVMLGNQFPVGYPEFYGDANGAALKFREWQRYKEGLGFVKARVYIPPQAIPPLPLHMGKLVFPTGYVEGTWTYHELNYSIENCGVEVQEFVECIHFKKTFAVFDNFISAFYEMKEQATIDGNLSLRTLAKLLMNVAYGWTCLARDDKTELKNIDELDKFLERFNYSNEELGYINIQSVVLSDSIQPQIGAYVTSYARLVLLDMLRRMSELGTVYYCDTDSIVCSGRMPDEFCSKSKLGLWDLEGQLYEGLFLMPKVYYETKTDKYNKVTGKWEPDETIKFKGVARDTQKSFDYLFYKKILEKLERGEGGTETVEKNKELLRSISYAQKKGIDPNNVELRDKKLNLENKQKRNMNYAGNSSEAWHMESLEMFKNFSFATPVRKWEEQGNLLDPCGTIERKET